MSSLFVEFTRLITSERVPEQGTGGKNEKELSLSADIDIHFISRGNIMTNKIWTKPTIEVTAIRGAQFNKDVQADNGGALKSAAHQS